MYSVFVNHCSWCLMVSNCCLHWTAFLTLGHCLILHFSPFKVPLLQLAVLLPCNLSSYKRTVICKWHVALCMSNPTQGWLKIPSMHYRSCVVKERCIVLKTHCLHQLCHRFISDSSNKEHCSSFWNISQLYKEQVHNCWLRFDECTLTLLGMMIEGFVMFCFWKYNSRET